MEVRKCYGHQGSTTSHLQLRHNKKKMQLDWRLKEDSKFCRMNAQTAAHKVLPLRAPLLDSSVYTQFGAVEFTSILKSLFTVLLSPFAGAKPCLKTVQKRQNGQIEQDSYRFVVYSCLASYAAFFFFSFLRCEKKNNNEPLTPLLPMDSKSGGHLCLKQD